MDILYWYNVTHFFPSENTIDQGPESVLSTAGTPVNKTSKFLPPRELTF